MSSLSKALRASAAGLVLLMSSGIVHAETIESALARAYENNPDLNAQRSGLRSTDELVPQARSGYLPTVGIYANGGRANTQGVSPGASPSPDYNFNTVPHSYGVTVNQTIYDFGRTSNKVDAAEASVLAARAGLQGFEQQVLFQAVTEYMDVVRDGAVVKLREANIDVLKEQLRQTQDRFNVGEVTRTDVAQVEAQLAAAQADLSSARANLEYSRALYRQVIGVEAKNVSDAPPLAKKVPMSLEDAFKIGESEHPQLIAARHAVTAAEANVKAAEAQLRPQIGLQGSYSNGWDQKAPNDNIQDIRLLGQVTMPVYEGGAIYSEVRAAKETLGQRQLEADSARDQVRSGVLAAWSQFESAKARVTSAEAQIAAAEVALNGIREEAKVGQRTTLDVLISAQDLLSAQVNLVTARRDWVVASYQVLSAVGRLSAARLGLKVANYNPESHYNAVRTKLIGTDTPQ